MTNNIVGIFLSLIGHSRTIFFFVCASRVLSVRMIDMGSEGNKVLSISVSLLCSL